MNAMEGRTREALHQVADGLIVSEHDLDRMEGNLMTLLDSPPTNERTAPRRRRDWAVVAVAAVALVIGGVALWQANANRPQNQPAGRLAPSQPLVPPELVGLWQNQPESSWLWEFAPDGRFLLVETVASYLRGGEGAANLVQRNGDLYTVVEPGSTDPAEACDKLRIQFVEPEVVSLREDCGGAPEDGLRLERVSPRDPSAPPLKPRFATDVSYPVREVAQLEGSWVHEGTNRVLVVGQPSAGEGLTYLLDDDGDGSVRPDQRGVLTLGADGSVRPRPKPTPAGGCAPAFSKVLSTTSTLVTTSGENSCFPAGSTQTWLRLT